MNRSKNRWLRLSFPVVATVAGFAGCGGVKSGVINIIADGGSSGGLAGSSAMGGEGDRGGMAGGSSDFAGEGGGGEGGTGCNADAPCDNGTDQGVCVAGVCSACVDPVDDVACVGAYGAGNLCIAGACIKAQCRTPDDCGNGGQSCVDNLCVGCASDGDCASANTVCNVESGACVANTACGTAVNGAACPVNPSDICCGTSGICAAASCCGSAACKTSPNASTNDGTCKNGQCESNTCMAPAGTTRYVDRAGPAGGSGSQLCPFDTLQAALDDLGSTGGTVLLKSNGLQPNPATLAVGSGINIVGADANFVACTATTCADPKSWPLLTTGDYRALNFLTAGSRQLRFVRFQGVGRVTATTAALYATAATLTMDHVDVSGYQFGMYADTGATINIGAGVHFHDNHDGLKIVDTGVSSGAAAQITVAAGADPTDFNNNDYGILCQGNGSLRISGPPWSASVKGLISVSNNGAVGVYWSSTQTKPAGVIDGLEVTGSGGDTAQTDRNGLLIFAHSVVKVRNSYIHANKTDGLNIATSGANTADGLSGIDLGLGTGTTAGRNTFAANALTGLCIQNAVATTAANSSLKADGNIFGTTAAGDCTKAGKYKHAMACTAGIDVSGGCSAAVSLLNCTASNSCQ